MKGDHCSEIYVKLHLLYHTSPAYEHDDPLPYPSYHGEERNGPGGMIVNGYEVDQEGSATNEQREE